MAPLPPRRPTQPGIPATLEGAHYRLDALEEREGTLSKVYRTVAGRVELLEKQLVEVRGMEGEGGKLQWLREEQQRSSAAQGMRIGQLETDIEQCRKETREVRETQIDMKARWAAGIAAVLAIVDLLLKLLK